MTITISIISAIFTTFFGWTGGRGDGYWQKHQNWPRWLLQSWTRDWLISPIVALTAYLLGVHSWWILASIPLTGGTLSTYWDKLFGFDNYWFHGFMIGIAAFPIAIVSGHWWLFGLRALFLAVWMGAWSAIISNADLEEAGRYASVGASVFLIC